MGGLLGYSSVNSIVNLNVPSSNGVSCGPKITAFHIMILLSVGAPDTPVGGSSWSLKWFKEGNLITKYGQNKTVVLLNLVEGQST